MNHLSATYRLPILLSILLALTVNIAHAQKLIEPLPKTPQEANREAREWATRTGVHFTENKGQIVDTKGDPRPEVLYKASSRGVDIYFAKDRISYAFLKVDGDVAQWIKNDGVESEKVKRPIFSAYRVDMELIGANPGTSVVAEDRIDGVDNYYLAHCPKGITGVRAFRKLIYRDVYPGIDMVVHGSGLGSKCEFVVHPGGRVSDIRMRYRSSDSVVLTNAGDLLVSSPYGYLQEEAPYSYQDLYGTHLSAPVASHYAIHDGVVGFDVPSYDPSQVLVIDPVQQWATFYGGAASNELLGGGDPTEVDRFGNVMVAGSANSAGFPVTNGSTFQGIEDGIVVKFTGTGDRAWATYCGGTRDEIAHGVSSDLDGNVLVTGHTESSNFPAVNAFQGNNGRAGASPGGLDWRDAFVIKFSPSGTVLWATYCGGNTRDDGYAFAVDSTQNVAVLVTAGSTGLGTLGAYKKDKPSGAGAGATDMDLLLVKYDPNGVKLWGSYFGGSKEDFGYAAASDNKDNIIITGWTESNTDFGVFGVNGGPPAQIAFGGQTDAFVVKFNRDGFAKWATFYGGTGTENKGFGANGTGYSGMATDGEGNIFIAGTTSRNVPTTPNAFQANNQNLAKSDAFVVKYDTNGAMVWATHFGGNDDDVGVGAASNQSGGVLITGFTKSANLITALAGGQPTFQANFVGGFGSDAFIAKFDKNGVAKWITYFGSTSDDQGEGISYDPYGSIVIAGQTLSNGAPFSRATPNPAPTQVNNPWQAANAGQHDMFVSLFCDPEPPKIDSTGPTTFCYGDSVTLSVLTGYTSTQWYEVNQPANVLSFTNELTIQRSGRYYVRVVNASGCIAYSDTINATRRDRNQPLMMSDSVFCEGDSVRLRVGPGLYQSYSWKRGGPQGPEVGKFSELWVKQAGLYRLDVVDGYGCRDSLEVNVTENPKPAPVTITSNPPAVSDTVVICEGSPALLSAQGGAPGTITWMPRNITQQTLTISKVSEEGIYYAVSRTAAGCQSVSDKLYVRVIPRPKPTINPDPTTTFCEGDSVTLSADRTYAHYSWSSGPDDTLRKLVVKEGGTYTLTVTNEFGCTGTAQITIQKVLRPKPTLTALSDTIFCEGSGVTLNATGGYLGYQWSTGDVGQTIVVRESGKYWVDANNGPGCDGRSDTISVRVRPKPQVIATGPVAVCVNASATYSVDSVPGYSYQWNVSGAGGAIVSGNGTHSIQVKWGPGGNGSVSVTVTDDTTRCSATQFLDVSVGNALVPTIGKSRSPVLCQGDTIILDAGDGYSTYTWSTGDTTQKIVVTQPGTFTVAVADPGGCSGTSEPVVVTINQAPAPKITASALTLCPGDSVILDAGAGYLKYRWADGRSIQKIVVRTAGTFQVTVTDSNGCVGITEAVSVVMNTPPKPVINGPNSVCINATESYEAPDDGSTTFDWKVTGGAIVSGQGTGTIIVQWGGTGTGTIELSEKSKTTGCSGSASPYSVSIGTTIVPNITSDKSLSICDGDSVTLSAPSGYATYAWFSPGWSDSVRGGASLTVSKAGTYSVFVTTSGGCSGSNFVSVSQKTPIVPTISPNGLVSLCEGDSATLTASGPFARYIWSTGETAQSITVKATGDYSVMVYDDDSCSGASAVVKVVVHPNPPAPVITDIGDSLMAPAAAAYEWRKDGSVIAGATTRTIYAPVTGAYTVKITDSNGCVASSGPITMLAVTSATVKLPDNVGQPGEKIEAPFELVSSQNLDRARVKGFTAKLRFRRSILMPLNLNFPTTYDPVTGDRTMELKGEHDGAQATGQLLFLEFRAMLGDTLNTEMAIENFQWLDSNGAPVPCDLTVINGHFALKNLCLTGGPRLVKGTGTFGLKAVRPNPTGGLTEIEYEVVENGRTQLFVVNPLGMRVATVIDENLAPGRYVATFNAGDLPSGSYFCVLQTPTQRTDQAIQIAK